MEQIIPRLRILPSKSFCRHFGHHLSVGSRRAADLIEKLQTLFAILTGGRDRVPMNEDPFALRTLFKTSRGGSESFQ